ncbi:MAG TPA: glycosyltransferase family 2 protein [Bacteroidales bacterium]|nr:glycosyltransferase family 2 protein [Bacteroidales bacterium]
MTKTAVVILNWNGRAFLEKFLPGVISGTTSPDTEVIVADNGSSDDSLSWLSVNHPDTRVILLDKNYGYAGGYNRALEQVEAEYYILLNSDVAVAKGWCDAMITFMDMHPAAGACQPKIRSFSEPEKFEYAGAAGGYLDKFGYPFCRGRMMNTTEADHGQYDDAREIFWASGACMTVRASAFEQCDGFDETFFTHMEEIDLCWRMQNAGFVIYYVPDTTVWHLGGGTLNYGSPQKVYYNFRNSLIMLSKNLPSRRIKRTIFIRQVLDGAAAIMFLFTSGWSSFAAVIKAHNDFRRARNSIKTLRSLSPVCETYGPPHTMMNKSFVFEYYIMKKRIFTSLKWQ